MAYLHLQLPLFYLISLIFFSLPLLNSSLIPHTHTTPQSLTTNQTDIHDVIPLYGLPPGLIPANVKFYKLQDSGNFLVILNSPCYVYFEEVDQLVYYGIDIRGKLSYGAVNEASGIQAKKSFFWLPVTGIQASESGDTIRFFVGPFYKTFPAISFSEIPDCRDEGKVSLRNPLKLVDSI